MKNMQVESMQMKMTQTENELERCREAIYSNDYYDFIMDYQGGSTMAEPICIQQVDNNYDIIHYRREGTPELNFQDYPYQTIPKCFALMDQSALEASGILRLQNTAALDLKGQGVMIGFVDTGIDYEHPAFRNSDGTTRILGIWDQTIADGTPPAGNLYGAFYDEDTINLALQSENPKNIVPEADEDGHGTFLAGVACGSADASADFSGAAPLSSIAVVKCKQAKQYLRDFFFVPDGVPCYQENDLMLAVMWLHRFAFERRMPLILCIGMGSSMGSHAGECPIAVLLDEIGRGRQRGVVVAAGNEANARHHYYQSGIEEGSQDNIEISVGEHVKGFQVELWASVPESYRISVLSPTGERLPKFGGRTGNRQVYNYLFEKTTLTVEYAIGGTRLGLQLIHIQFENPLAGIWTLEVTPELILSGSFNCWLPLEQFLSGEVFFLRSNPDITITAPGMSTVAVTTGAYQAKNGSIYPDSGRGYSTINVVKPDILAPGVNVYGPLVRGGYGARSGTSVSAAITAGGCAQIFQWGIVENNLMYLNSTILSNLLIRGATRSQDRTYPGTAYGYGLLDVYNALNRLRTV
jgi:hypothetical protein